jgi:hypothetical protein
MTSTLAVGLKEPLVAWLTQAGVQPSDLRLLTAGVLEMAAVDHWVGVPTPDPEMVRVQLNAPEPREGEAPGWLEFRPGEWEGVQQAFCCWTSDLVAVQISR